MNGPQFESLLRKDWATILSNTLLSSHVIAHLTSLLSERLDCYENCGYIQHWSVEHGVLNPSALNALDRCRLQGSFVIQAQLLGPPYGQYQVTLGFNNLYPPPGEMRETPPKALNRWELIAMEINEVSSNPEVDKFQDREDTCVNKPHENMPGIVPFER